MVDISDIVTPRGMKLLEVNELGIVQESQTKALGYKAAYRCPECHVLREMLVAGTEEDSQANIEDILGAAMERDWDTHVIQFHQYAGTRMSPREAMKDERTKRELAGTIRDWRKHAKKRAESSTGKLFF